MANTNTKKVTAHDEKLESVANNEAVAAKPKKKELRKFAQDDLILCKSVTYGELLLPGKKSKLLYIWANHGDATEVEFQDLQALRSTRSAYLMNPYFVIEDDELLEQWPDLKAIYDKAAEIDIDSLFTLPLNQFKKKLRDLPVGFRDSVKNIAGEKIRDGSLDSIAKIKAIDEALGTELKLMIE